MATKNTAGAPAPADALYEEIKVKLLEEAKAEEKKL